MTSLTSQQVLDLFRRVGALLEGHFKLSSGLHSPGFMQSALVLQYPREAEALGAALADAVRVQKPDLVMSPALGGIVIGQEVARALNVPAIFAERQEGALALRRGFAVAAGARVLVIEDVVTTGGSTRETMDVAMRAGGVVVGAGSIIDRSGGNQGLSVPYSSLAQVAFPTYQPDACPLCAAGSTAIKPGSRA